MPHTSRIFIFQQGIRHTVIITICAVLLVACGTPAAQHQQSSAVSAAPSSAQDQPATQILPTTQPTPTISQNVPQGYLAIRDTYVTFLQWTEDQQGQATGRYQNVQLQYGSGIEATNGTLSIAKQQGSNEMQITFDGKTPYIGTLTDTAITMVMPSDNGELQTVEFQRASVEDYNQAVRAFRQRIEQQAAEQQALADEQTRIDTLLREWQAAADRAEEAIGAHTVTEPSTWFTEQDDGILAGIVRNAQAQLTNAKDQQQLGYCDSMRAYGDSARAYQQSFKEYQRSFNATVEDFNSAVSVMKAKRETLADTAPQNVVETTSTIEGRARPIFDLVGKKYDQADQQIQAIVEEAEALPCTPAEQ